jgi:hypothetical protein
MPPPRERRSGDNYQGVGDRWRRPEAGGNVSDSPCSVRPAVRSIECVDSGEESLPRSRVLPRRRSEERWLIGILVWIRGPESCGSAQELDVARCRCSKRVDTAHGSPCGSSRYSVRVLAKDRRHERRRAAIGACAPGCRVKVWTRDLRSGTSGRWNAPGRRSGCRSRTFARRSRLRPRGN